MPFMGNGNVSLKGNGPGHLSPNVLALAKQLQAQANQNSGTFFGFGGSATAGFRSP